MAGQIEGKISADEFIDMSEAKRTTLKEALQRYLDSVTDAKKGKKQERNRILWLQRQPIAARFLASIRTADVTDFRNELEKAGNAPSTIKNKLTIISQV